MSIPTGNGWSRCPPGELTRLASRLSGRRWIGLLLKVAASLVTLALVVGVGWAVTSYLAGPSGYHPSGAPCGGAPVEPCHPVPAPAPDAEP
jgi:hypothetical protein